MKHYRVVKKSTHVLIAISALAVFFNLALLGAATSGLLEVSKPEKTVAVDVNPCIGNGVKISLEEASTNKAINNRFNIILESSDNPVKTYMVSYYVYDVGTDKIVSVDKDLGPYTLGIGESPHYLPITLSGTGPKQIYATYSLELTGTGGSYYCSDNIETNKIDITGVDPISNSTNIDISVPEKTDKGNSVPVAGTIRGANGKKYALYISKGGTCSNQPENEACWSEKTHGEIALDPFTFSYSWPTTDSDIGRHAVKIKVYKEGNTDPTDGKVVYTTICNPGTANTSCVADNGDTPSTTTDDPITTPKEIAQFSTFSSPFKMPSAIKGAGDIIQVIIVILEELLGAFAFIGIVVSGIQYISSGGDSAKAEKAKKNLIFCVIGIIIAVLALTLQSIIARFWAGPS